MFEPMQGVIPATADHANPAGPGANKGPAWPPTGHDGLKTPWGATVGATTTDDLRGLFARLGIPDAFSRPRNELIGDYAAMLKRVGDEASRVAIDAWLIQHRT
jgi:hypothetical protein